MVNNVGVGSVVVAADAAHVLSASSEQVNELARILEVAGWRFLQGMNSSMSTAFHYSPNTALNQEYSVEPFLEIIIFASDYVGYLRPSCMPMPAMLTKGPAPNSA
ncbi:hypothetical protein PAXINDRAFT_17146 [Paxillus involutus ATCC 200175]|uniref:Uncharacterized protein n=1 Tax=Paxillus involutus ATCC 200175 TaxID=664439 RepID=A0A0C9T250_PAXIN|nr:hypothetical protein PAXINDRAFT_17146 [Paxillus involutus ATCC 200175]